MSGRIIVLPDDLTCKIAAGEVVERPASIVKELLENAIDAGATDVAIELERGGCSSIRIIDNGEGIDQKDISLAFDRYATSKIYQFDDIYKVTSYGFRGEALPSIASISQIEMNTRRQASLSGTKIIVESGQVKMIAEVGCPIGTSVSVSKIFDSVPVRKKFLKTETTEQGHCIDVITKMALAHPGIRIKVTANSKDILSLPATGDMFERVSLVLGMNLMNDMLPVKLTRGDMTVRGFISRPEQTRSSSKHMYFYVNRRYVRDYLLNHAVMTANRRLIEGKRFPSVVLFFDVSPGDVDVNVHPTKMEVRFRNPRAVYDLTAESIVSALASVSPLAETSQMTASSAQGLQKHPENYKIRIEEALKRYTLSSGRGKLFFNQGSIHSQKHHPEEYVLEQENQAMQTPEAEGKTILFSELEYLGQVAGTFLVFSSSDGLTLVDQHAAHERVLFEKLKVGSRQEEDNMISQGLLIPEVVSLSPGDFAFLMEAAQMLEEIGISIEQFGGNAVVVKAIPAILAHIQPKEIITDLLDEFSGVDRRMNIQEKKDMIFSFLACRGAVKANHELSTSEVGMLCHELDNTSFPSTCPHGRPVYISFNIKDMEKMFRRR